MAVQAQQHHPSNVFMPEPRTSVRAKENRSAIGMSLNEAFQLQQSNVNMNVNPVSFPHLFPVYNSGAVAGLNFGQQQVLNGTVFSDPESDLTCNVSGSRKRAREDNNMMLSQQQQHQHHKQHHQQLAMMNMNMANMAVMANPSTNHNHNPNPNSNPTSAALVQTIPAISSMVSTGLQLAYEETGRLNHAPTLMPATTATTHNNNFISILGEDVAAQMQQQQQEIDQLVKFHSEKLRAALEEKRRANARALLSAVEEGIMGRIRSRELELEKVSRKNLELEERVKKLGMEAQLWQNVAKKNECAVNALRANLEQVLAQSREQQQSRAGDGLAGLGDCAEDAQSCCNDGGAADAAAAAEDDAHSRTLRENRELKEQRICRLCRTHDSSILLLPCRHLSLCKHCDCRTDTCPICKEPKNASVQVYLC